MRLEKLRHIQILKILINAEKEVTADQLARATRSSLRTIKYDIGILNRFCADEGCRIDSYKAKGYRLNVTKLILLIFAFALVGAAIGLF